MRDFGLAPMHGLLLWLTLVMLSLPFVFGLAGSAAGTGALWGVAAFIVIVYLFVWLYMRPTRFELGSDSLDIVWPVRRRSNPFAAMQSVESITGAEFRKQYGIGYRIGAGGLFGGFGLYKTKSETFEFYVSRLDYFVIIERINARPLMITPETPDRLVAELSARIAAA